jgi:hypothetical protein
VEKVHPSDKNYETVAQQSHWKNAVHRPP